MLFKYEGIKGDNYIKGEIVARSKKEVIDLLSEDEILIIKVKRKFDFNVKISKLNKDKNLYNFINQLSILIDGGIEISDALRIMYRDKKIFRDFPCLDSIIHDLESGKTLSKSLKNNESYFSDQLISSVKVGEESGNLNIILNQLSIYYENKIELNTKKNISLVYPKILLFISILVVSFLFIFVIPVYESIFSEFLIELPFITRMIISFGNFVEGYYLLVIAFILIFIIILKYLKKNYIFKYAIDKFKVNFFRKYNISLSYFAVEYFYHTSMLLKSGVPILDTILININLTENLFIKNKLENIFIKVKSGESLGKSLEESTIFDNISIAIVNSAEISGNLTQSLNKLYEYNKINFNWISKKYISLLEPTMIIILAFIVGSIVMSVTMPVFEIMQQY